MIKKLKKLLAAGAATLATLALSVAPVAAASSYELFGDASLVSPGYNSDTAVQLVSDTDPGYGSVEFTYPDGSTFADLAVLSTDFNVTDDNCGGGAPRFSIGVDQGGTTKNIFVYLGDAPNYNTCDPNTWVSTGDLLETGTSVDTSQLGGAFYQDYDAAIAAYGTLAITSISLVTDAGWSQLDGEQTVLADNVTINDVVFGFEAGSEEPVMPTAKDDCKQGGWSEYGVFKNQGDCVSFVASQGRNKPAFANQN